MDISRRGFVVLTGIAAIAQSAAAEEGSYNHLIPKYGYENFLKGGTIVVPHRQINGVPLYTMKYVAEGKIINELFIGPYRYAIGISTGDDSTSMFLVDNKGDGVFRQKFPISFTIEVPEWVYKRLKTTKESL